MILLQKDYYLDHEGTPTDLELEDFLLIYIREQKPIFNEKQCYYREPENRPIRMTLHWYVKYSGWYSVTITDQDKTIEDLRKRMPHIYPV